MQISTVTQILKRHTLTQERAHSQTSHRPLLGPFLETWSVRLQLIPKVRGGCENVSTVYPGAFWRLYCSCSHCDLDTVTVSGSTACLQLGEVLLLVVKYHHLRSSLCRELHSASRVKTVFVLLFCVQCSAMNLWLHYFYFSSDWFLSPFLR